MHTRSLLKRIGVLWHSGGREHGRRESPAKIIAVVALAFSTLTFISVQADQRKLAQESKLQLEHLRNDLDAEIRRNSEVRAHKDAISDERRLALNVELETARKDVYAWQRTLAESELVLLTLRSELQTYEDANRVLMAEATRNKIALQEQMIAQQQQELQTVFRRRAELEAKLQ